MIMLHTMVPSRGIDLLLALFVGLLFLSAVDVAAVSSPSEPTTAGSRVGSQLPSRDNPTDVALLKCSACQSASDIMKAHLEDALFEFQHHAVPDEDTRHTFMAAAVDGTCENEQRLVGLLRKPDNPKVWPEFRHEFRDDYKGDLVKAAWITELWTAECFDVMSRMKPQFLGHSLGGRHAEWCPHCNNPPPTQQQARSAPAPSDRDEL